MKKKLVVLVMLLTFLILMCSLIFIPKLIKKNKLEKELVAVATSYYENEFAKYMPDMLKKNGVLKIEVSILKQLGKNVLIFEQNNCNLENTYVTLIYNKNGYDIQTHIDCK